MYMRQWGSCYPQTFAAHRVQHLQSEAANRANSVFHPSGGGKWVVMYVQSMYQRRRRPLNGRPALRMAVGVQAEVRGRGDRAAHRLYASCLWHKSAAAAVVCGLWRYINVICVCLIRAVNLNEMVTVTGLTCHSNKSLWVCSWYCVWKFDAKKTISCDKNVDECCAAPTDTERTDNISTYSLNLSSIRWLQRTWFQCPTSHVSSDARFAPVSTPRWLQLCANDWHNDESFSMIAF